MASYTWTGSGDGSSWNDPTNWDNDTTGDSPATSSPGSGDDASIDGASITDAGSADQVDASGLDIVGSISASDYNGDDTTVEDGGSLTVSGTLEEGSDLSVEGSITADNVISDGTADVGKSGDLSITTSYKDEGGTDVEKGGSLTISDQHGFLQEDDTLTVEGTVMTPELINNGTIDVEQDGELTVSTYFKDEGGTTVDSGGTLTLTDPVGYIQEDSTLTVEGDVTATTIINSGSIEVEQDGELDLSDGTGYDGKSGSSLTIEDGGTADFESSTSQSTSMNVEEGSVTVTGSGSSLTTGTGGVVIGGTGSGTLTIEDGATVEASNATPETFTALALGGASGSGELIVEGSGSTLTVGPGELQIGAFGFGELDISDGGTVNAEDTTFGLGIGDFAGSTGTVDITGSSSTLDVDGPITVGDLGDGTFTIEDGATVEATSDDTNAAVRVASESGSSGTLEITGSGSMLTANGSIYVGNTGTFTVEDSADVEVSGGENTIPGNGQAGVDIEGMGSIDDATLDSSDGFFAIGQTNTAGFSAEDGASVKASYTSLGAFPGGDGTLTISGDGTSWSDVGPSGGLGGSGGMSVGGGGYNGSASTGGDGSLTVSDGASLTETTGFDVALSTGSTGTVEVTGSGTTLSIGGTLGIGDSGDGILTVEDGADVEVATESSDGFIDIGENEGSTGSLDLTGAGTEMSTAGAAYIGDAGTGTLTIEDGADFESTYTDGPAIDIGLESTGNGTLIVEGSSTSLTLDSGGILIVGDAGVGDLDITGDGSSLSSDGSVIVGVSGQGTMTVEDGADVDIEAGSSDDYLDVGENEGGVGSLDITGAGTRLTTNVETYIGDSGTGSLTVEDGADFESTYADGPTVDLGFLSTGDGSLIIDGSSTTLTIDSGLDVIVGDAGAGDLSVQGGATFDVASTDPEGYFALAIGNETTGDGTVTVDGKGSTLTAGDGGIVVGYAGQGSLTVSNGATLEVTDETFGFVIGAIDGAMGIVDVTGDGSTLNSDGPIIVGEDGTGTLTIEDGGNLTTSSEDTYMSIGSEENGEGTFTVTGASTAVEYDGMLTVGDAGTGTFDLAEGATFTIESDVIIGANGNGTLDIESGATATIGGELSVGTGEESVGKIVIAGEGSSLTVNSDLILGQGGEADLTISDGGDLTVNGDVDARDSTVDIEGDPTINGNLNLGMATTNAAGLTQTGIATWMLGGGATLTVTGSTRIGVTAGDMGTLTVTGANTQFVVETDLFVGDAGTGTLNVQNGAVTNVTGAITLGAQTTGAGKLTINGNDSIVNAGTQDVTIGDAGSGTLNVQMAGLFDADSVGVTLGSQSGSIGAITVANEDSEVDAGTLTVGDEGVGTVTISDGGELSVGGDATLGGQSSGSGTVTVADDQSNFDVGGDLTVGDAGNGTLVDDGDTSVSGKLSVGAQSGGSGQVTVAAGTLDVDGDATVGDEGSGTLLVELGGTFTAEDVALGKVLGSSGMFSVDGDETSATTNDLTVGTSGDGELHVSDGASLTTHGDATLGDAVSANIQTALVDTQANWGIDGDLTVGGAGIATMSLMSGGSVTDSGNVVLGDQGAASGQLTVSGFTTAPDGTAPSTLNWGDTLTVGSQGQGTLIISDGALVALTEGGTGAVDIAAQAGSVGIITVDGTDSLLDAADLVIGGTLLAAGGDGTLTAQNGGSIDLTDTVTMWNGLVDVANGGLLVVGTLPSSSDPDADSAVLVRSDGLLTGDGRIAGDVIDDGTVDAENGTLTIDGAVSGTGLIDIGAHAAAELDGSVASATRTDFLTNNGTLILDQPSQFSGTIDGLALGDTIDLADVDFSYGASAQLLDHNVLQIVTGGASPSTYDLQLDRAQSFSDESFKLSSDQDGGLDINLNAGLSMNVVYDKSVATAPAAFRAAIDQAVSLYETEFTNPDTININIGWGVVQGDPIAANANATTYEAPGPISYTYTQIYNALIAGASSDVQRQAYLTLPDPAAANNPFTNDMFANGIANAQALGLVGNNSAGIDGWVGFNTNPNWSFDGSGTPANSVDFLGTAEHEISHLMGRTTRLGGETLFKTADGTTVGYTNANSPMDLFRYAGPGTFDLAPATQSFNFNVYPTGYFSINAGATSLGTFNNFLDNGDLSGWLAQGAPLPNDAFDFAAGRGPAPLSQTDLALMNVIGWKTATSLGPLSATPFLNAEVSTGNTLDVTVSAFSTLIDHGGSVIVESGALLSGSTIDNGGTVELKAGASAPDGIIFADTGNLLQIDGPTMPTVTIAGFVDTAKYGDRIDLAGVGYNGGGHVDLLANGVLEVSENSQTFDLQLYPGGSYEYFHLSPDGGTGTLITESAVACYCRGTLIATPAGSVPVESLKIGDEVVTASGVERPIKWIGTRSYGGRFIMGRADILPICFKAGSLDVHVPQRDLWISPHHAMYLDGVLIEARDLVNGISIVQADSVEKVEYFHVELDSHDVILAEGALSETFLDDDSRAMFHNADEYGALYPADAPVAPRYCAKRCAEGYEIEAVRGRIAQRAGLRSAGVETAAALRGYIDRVDAGGIAGWAQNPDHPEAPVCLDVLVDGRLVGQTLANGFRGDLARAGIGSGRHGFSFALPDGVCVSAKSVEVCRSFDKAMLPVLGRATRRDARNIGTIWAIPMPGRSGDMKKRSLTA